MLTLEPFSEDQGRSAVHPARGIPPISFLAPCGFTHPLTRTHVRLLGPCFKTGRIGCPQAGAGSTQTAPRGATGSGHDGALTLSGAPFQGTWARSAAEDASPDYNSDSEAVRFSSWADPGSLAVTKGILSPPDRGAVAVEASSQERHIGVFIKGLPHSSRHTTQYEGLFQPTTSRASTEGDSSLGQPHHKHGETNLRPDAMCPDKGCMVGGDAMRDAQAGVPSAGWLWAQLAFKNSMGFDNDPSAGSPTETLLRLLLPLNDKVQWNSRDVAGGEPPTLRSRSLTELTRQIAPPTKNGHAPPPIESKKELSVCQSILSGITAAAGTRLALQWILVKGFRLYSFQLPDSFEPGIVIYCHYLPCQDWVICAPAAFLGCGSRFSGSLSGIEP
ncbi:hypothetical protein L1887_60932 [Cichorium endivia]|nr:hypothetical protein L1887_60932 [Cichorium endivia]